MRIGIQFHTDGQRYEFDLTPDSSGWRFNHNRCNNAGLVAALNVIHQNAERTAQQVEHDRRRCRWDGLGFDWQCPHYPAMPCRKPHARQNKPLLAVISSSYYGPVIRPIGQMSLFEPNITHRRQWQHVTGQIIDAPEQPFTTRVIVCKEMALIALNVLQQHEHPIAWRVRPVNETKAGEAWAEAMAQRHAGRIAPCVFQAV